MSQQRNSQMMGGGNYNQQINETTLTKVFVGGLAWETQRDTMRHYFEQFGEILEAVVITDKNTGKSKGYGFVTYKEPKAARRACRNPSPVIDGRRANCNIAAFGAQKTHPPSLHHGRGQVRPASGLVAPIPLQPPFHNLHPPTGQYTFPYSGYGYGGYSQEHMYPLNYYNSAYGGQQVPPYYPTGGSSGMFHNFYPFYPQFAQGNQAQAQAHGFGVQYPQMVQYPYLPQQTGILSLPSSMPMEPPPTTTTTTTNTGITTETTEEVATTEIIGTDSKEPEASERNQTT